MRYFGSKGSTVESVHEIISARFPAGTFCDAFGGIATVGSYFKAQGYSVWTGDILTTAYCFQVARVKLNRTPSFSRLKRALKLQKSRQIANYLNNVPPVEGWLTSEYAKRRGFFTYQNARKIDGCRIRINDWFKKEWINENERAFLLASLINSVDRVANTAGTYYAYLKSWDRKALRPFRFEVISPTPGTEDCHCFLSEANDLVGARQFDILYLDPPYNERCFGSYYHLAESLARCEEPDVRGQSGIPIVPRVRSAFNRPALAANALEQLLERARFRLLVFHYSDDGLISKTKIRRLLRSLGKVEEFRINSRGYTTAHSARTVEHRLYVVNHG